MTFGLEPHHWALVSDLVLRPLREHGAELWIFGSRARGTHHQFSDLDVLYSIEEGRMRLATVARIEENLTNSRLPIKIDLVAERDLAASYRASVFADRISI